MRRAAWLLLALAVAARAYRCALTPVPDLDGVAYLWMAQQWAGGDVGKLFATVFHPLYPFLVGLLLRWWPGLDIVVAGQFVAGSCAALAVVPLWLVARQLFGERAAWWGGVMYALGTWFARYPAECMSEGPFYLLVTASAWAVLRPRPRPMLAGIAAGLAFLARPEGALMAAAAALFFAAHRRWSRVAVVAFAAMAVGALLPLGSVATGHGFTLTPKAVFNWQVGAGASDNPLLYYLQQGWLLLGDAWEGLGYVVFPLLLLGAARWRPRWLGDVRLVLLLPLAAQCALIPLLKSHHRFVSGLGVLLLPFAGAMFADLLARVRRRGRWLPWLSIALLLGSEARLWLDLPNDRRIERDLGRELGRRLRYGEVLASDMPRLLFFAGLQPPPPARITLADVLTRARRPDCRFVVLKKGRTALDSGDLAILGLEPEELPVLLCADPGAADIRLFARRDRR